MRELTAQFPAITPLALVLKQFLTDRSLDQPYTGGLSSYCLVFLHLLRCCVCVYVCVLILYFFSPFYVCVFSWVGETCVNLVGMESWPERNNMCMSFSCKKEATSRRSNKACQFFTSHLGLSWILL